MTSKFLKYCNFELMFEFRELLNIVYIIFVINYNEILNNLTNWKIEITYNFKDM